MASPIRRITPYNHRNTAPGLIAFFEDQRSWLERSYPTLARIPEAWNGTTPTELIGKMIARNDVRYYAVEDTSIDARPTIGIAAAALNARMWHGSGAFGGVGLNYALHEKYQDDQKMHQRVGGALLTVAGGVMPKMRRRTFSAPTLKKVDTYNPDTDTLIHLQAHESAMPEIPRGALVFLNNDTVEHAPIGLTEREEMAPIDAPSLGGFVHASGESHIFRLGETKGQLYFEEFDNLTR